MKLDVREYTTPTATHETTPKTEPSTTTSSVAMTTPTPNNP